MKSFLFFLSLLLLPALPLKAQIQSPEAVIQFAKYARNITTGSTSFTSTINAQGTDEVEFQIVVRNAGSQAAIVFVRDILPNGLSLITGSVKIAGAVAGDALTREGISLGSIPAGGEKIVLFRTRVAQGIGTGTVLTNQIVVVADATTKTGTAMVRISPRGAPTGPGGITTGPVNTLPWVLGGGFLSALGTYLLLFKARFREKNIFSIYSNIRLQKVIKDLKKEEGFPDF